MKTSLISLFITLLWISGAQAQHGIHASEAAPAAEEGVTVSIRQTDLSLCDTPFYVGFYDLTVTVFAIGAENVTVSDYEEKVFALIRSSEEFAGGGAEAFVDHAKDIPRQMVEIIREDPTVLDSCSNFSVALIGPP